VLPIIISAHLVGFFSGTSSSFKRVSVQGSRWGVNKKKGAARRG
jgi:hypothetical protein